MNTTTLNEKHRKERVGQENYNNQGLHMVIKEYYTRRKILVLFDDGYVKTTDYKSFINGNVKNDQVIIPTLWGIGTVSGMYRPKDYPKEYRAWRNMVYRCISDDYKEKHPTYKNVSCCAEWLEFDNFCQWVITQENYSVLKDTEWAPDKDILIKGNKIYSPNTVCLVPQNVNKLFLKHDSKHGELPIGVTLNKNSKSNKYVARCNNPFGKNWSKNCPTIQEAFMAYKKKKEEIIKKVAEIELEKGTITHRCYEAMLSYKVEITD